MHYKERYTGWVKPSEGYEFFTPECQRLCDECCEIVNYRNSSKMQEPLDRLVRNRVALLAEHLRLCKNPEVLARMKKTIAYQRSLLTDPGAVFCRMPS